MYSEKRRERDGHKGGKRRREKERATHSTLACPYRGRGGVNTPVPLSFRSHNMPSAEETTYLIEVMPDTTQDYFSRDVDLLVSQIKENLRLSSLKAKSSVSHKNRPSPYKVPSRSWADPNGCEVCGTRSTGAHDHRHHMAHNHKRPTAREDDPYELLQELLREGGLIKEAVKRLQANLDELESSEVEEEDDEQSTVYRRKPYIYDSEDEQLPPVYEPLDL